MKKFLLSLLLSLPLIAFATFEDGVDAFNRADYSRAAMEWQPLANSGDPDAARNLARLYQQGLGVKTDLIKARQLYRLASARCNATAQNNLGLMMLNGHGGEKDLVGAFKLKKRQCKVCIQMQMQWAILQGCISQVRVHRQMLLRLTSGSYFMASTPLM
jgi:TPR repeat protein